MAEFAMEGILPDVSRDMSVSIPEAGSMISVYALGVCVGSLFLIALYKLAPKKIIIGLVSLMLIGAVLSLVAQNFFFLLLARFISGLPHGAYYGVGTLIATRLADERHKTSAVALMCAGMTFANLLGVPVSTFLSSQLSWRLPFAMISIIGVVAIVLALKWIPNLEPLPNQDLKDNLNFSEILTHGSLSLPRCLVMEVFLPGIVIFRQLWWRVEDSLRLFSLSLWYLQVAEWYVVIC